MMESTINKDEFDIPAVSEVPSLAAILNSRDTFELDAASFSSSSNYDSSGECTYSVIQSDILNVTLKRTFFNSGFINSGSLTVINCAKNIIVVGTSKGLILAFTLDDEFLWIVHDDSSNDQGGISAIAVTPVQEDKLLIGYERGSISLMNTNDGKILLRLPDAHAPISAVLNLRFSDDPQLALCADSSGSVFTIKLSKRLNSWTANSKCLFSGARGEVCTLEPLILGTGQHSFKPRVIVALASFSKVIVLTVRPVNQIIYAFPLPASRTLLPVVSWQTFDKCRKTQMSDVILVFGRGANLYIHRIYFNPDDRNHLIWSALRHIVFPHELIAVNWFSLNHLIYIDTNEILHVLDSKDFNEIETADLTHLQLVYACAHFKALATGGQVSVAFTLAGERACYNSVTTKESVCLILGTETVQKLTLRDFESQFRYLADLRRWKDLFHYNLNNQPCLPTHMPLLLCVDHFTKWLESAHDYDVDKVTLFSAIRFCVKVNKMNFLSNNLWNVVEHHKMYKSWFLDILTGLVHDNEVTNISPIIVQQLFEHNENEAKFDQIEMLILNLDKFCLDLDQAMKLCRKYGLFDGYFYLMTQVFNDFIEPFIELTPKLTKNNHRLGNSLFVYISSCFSGVGYPKGTISKDQVSSLKHDILRCLMTSRPRVVIEGENNKYLYLRKLLMFHIREFLNVLKVGFSQIEFVGDLGNLQQRRLVDVLLEVVRPPDFSHCDMVILAFYIGNLIVENKLNCDDQLLKNVLDKLFYSTANLSLRDHEEREQLVIDLCNGDKLGFISKEDLINLALKKNSYKLAITLYELTGQFDNIINCYLIDSRRKNEVFNYLKRYAEDKSRLIIIQIRANFKQLLTLNAKGLISIVYQYFRPFLQDERFETYLLNVLENCDELLLETFHELFSLDMLTFSSNFQQIYVELMCKLDDNKLIEFLQTCPKTTNLKIFQKITKKYRKHDASIYIHRTLEEYREALDVLIERIDELVLNNENVEIRLLEACAICAKSSDKQLWLKLLKCRDFESNLLQTVISLAIRDVDLEIILDTLTTAHYRDVKSVVNRILSDFAFKSLLMSAVKTIHGQDLFSILESKISVATKGFLCRNYCGICDKYLLYDGQSVVFWCGHSFHATCIGFKSESDSLVCETCNKTANSLKNFESSVYYVKNEEYVIKPDLEHLF